MISLKNRMFLSLLAFTILLLFTAPFMSAGLPKKTSPPDCIDADNDGTYAFDSLNCPKGNDCDDNNAQLIGVKDDTYIIHDVVVCSGAYTVKDKANNGIFIVNDGKNHMLDCNGASIRGAGNGYGLFSTGIDGLTIKNCSFEDFSGGIYLAHLSYANIHDSSFISNVQGVSLYNISESTLSSNFFQQNTVQGAFFDSGGRNVITSNVYTGNPSFGLHIFNSPLNIVKGNTFSSNNIGMLLVMSNGTMIDANLFDKNQQGLYISKIIASMVNSVIDNTFSFNTVQGIFLDYYTTNNVLYHNNFVSNGIQAQDDGSNTWSFQGQGNYWSDFDDPEEGCEDVNLDFICDAPYSLYSGDQDSYPFVVKNGWGCLIQKPGLAGTLSGGSWIAQTRCLT